ncbi:MAG TPA: DUF6390 family protein [Ktedonobacterales bacterium]
MIDVPLSGALLFGRYAFPPNQLGYCGPEDHAALFQYVSSGASDSGLLELERRFEGAYPYLRLIALANNIPDPFDKRVVEAYWIGNDYLERVSASPFYTSLDERFRNRMGKSDFTWLTSKLEQNARPHHNFHVFEVYLRTGLMNDNRATIALERMDSCRISWGRVARVDGAELVVERPALELREGKLALGEPTEKRVTRQIDGRGFTDRARPGDYVSVHWSWACDTLDDTSLRRLMANTRRYLALANQTI